VIPALLVIVSLFAASCAFWGDANPDWRTYESIYDDAGGYLAAQGRDPLFTLLIQSAHEALGAGGYEFFRIVVFAVVAANATMLALRMPTDKQLNPCKGVQSTVGSVLQGLTIAACVTAAFLTKSVIQVREGLAFALVAAAIFRVMRCRVDGRRAQVLIYSLLTAAVLIHNGTTAYLIVYALAHMSSLVFQRRGRKIGSCHYAVMALAAVSGVAVGMYALYASEPLQEALQQLGVEASSESEASGLKLLFWVAQGGLLLLVVKELLHAAEEMPDVIGARFAVVHATFVLPFLYVLSVYMIVTSQPLPILSMVGRMLATAFGIALLGLVLRQRATILSLAAALFLIVDQLRVIQASFV
jgi:hypothetical protein